LDAPGPRDVVVDGEHGRLLPIEATPDAFAGDLAALREAPAVRQRWSDVARLHAERYSHQACTDRLVRIYTELTADRPEPAPITPINQAMKRLRTEWALLAEKARIAAATVTRTSREEAPAPGADAPR
jgi:hypothetical protein